MELCRRSAQAPPLAGTHPNSAHGRLAGMPSSVIRHFHYSPETSELTVEFVTGRRYVYSGVPLEEAEVMRGAYSKGIFFNRRIRDRFPWREVV